MKTETGSLGRLSQRARSHSLVSFNRERGKVPLRIAFALRSNPGQMARRPDKPDAFGSAFEFPCPPTDNSTDHSAHACRYGRALIGSGAAPCRLGNSWSLAPSHQRASVHRLGRPCRRNFHRHDGSHSCTAKSCLTKSYIRELLDEPATASRSYGP
jgi:hypothetical protein